MEAAGMGRQKGRGRGHGKRSEHLRERHGPVHLQLQCGDLVAQRDLERVARLLARGSSLEIRGRSGEIAARLLGVEEARVLLVAQQLRLVQRGLPGGGQASDRRLAGA